jgi:hypothetical protein
VAFLKAFYQVYKWRLEFEDLFLAIDPISFEETGQMGEYVNEGILWQHMQAFDGGVDCKDQFVEQRLEIRLLDGELESPGVVPVEEVDQDRAGSDMWVPEQLII